MGIGGARDSVEKMVPTLPGLSLGEGPTRRLGSGRQDRQGLGTTSANAGAVRPVPFAPTLTSQQVIHFFKNKVRDYLLLLLFL